MDLEECLELYTNEDIIVLQKISYNVSIDNAPPIYEHMDLYYKTRIKESMTNNIKFVVGRIEKENKDYFQQFKEYLLGDNQDDLTKIRVEEILYNFGIMYPGQVIPSGLNKYLVNIYKQEFIWINNCFIKQKNIYSIYLLFIITMFKLVKYKDRQIDTLENLKNKYGDKKSDLLLGVMNEFNIISIKSRPMIEVDENLLVRLYDDKNLIESIHNFYEFLFGKSNCLKDIYILAKKIINIQNHELDWINISKFKDLIEEGSLDVLVDFDILERTVVNSMELIRPTAIGYTVLTNQLSCRWKECEYYIETEKQIIIPHNYKPSMILKLLLKYELINKDFLFVFDRADLLDIV